MRRRCPLDGGRMAGAQLETVAVSGRRETGAGMYRHHYRCEAHYGRFRQFVELSRQARSAPGGCPRLGSEHHLDTRRRRRQRSHVIAECPSLDAFERERAARRADPEYMKTFPPAAHDARRSVTSCSSSRRTPGNCASSTESPMGPTSSAGGVGSEEALLDHEPRSRRS